MKKKKWQFNVGDIVETFVTSNDKYVRGKVIRQCIGQGGLKYDKKTNGYYYHPNILLPKYEVEFPKGKTYLKVLICDELGMKRIKKAALMEKKKKRN